MPLRATELWMLVEPVATAVLNFSKKSSAVFFAALLMRRWPSWASFPVYKFFSTAVTYPLLFSLTPWDKLVAAFNISNMITIFCTVVTLMAVGAVVGWFLGICAILVTTAPFAETTGFSELNDQLRQNFADGIAVMTPGIAAQRSCAV